MAKQIVKGGGLEPSDRLASAETEEMAKIVQENGSDGLVSAENEEVAQKSKALKSKRRSCRCGKFKRDKLAYCLGPKCPYDWIHFSCAGIKVLPDRFYCCDKCRDEDLAAAKYNEEIEKQEKAALVDFEYCTCKKQLGGEMVGCDRDNCDIGWYHPECVGLTEIPKGKWVCPNCKAKKKKKPIVQSERTRTQSSNTPQGSSTSGLEGTAEATNNEGDTGDDLLLAPYLAQVPKEKRNNLIFPIGLVKVLNDDSDLVNRQLKLPKLPPRYTLDDILTKFLQFQYDPNYPDLEDVKNDIDDLVIFFNKVINLRILYKLEFAQHLACLNKKRLDFCLSDLAADDFLDQEEFNHGLESLMSEEAKEDEDMAFKPPKQVKPDATTEGESDKRQFRETQNEKSTTEQPSLNVVASPKKKGKVEQAGLKNFEISDDFNFADTYGFIHLVRFFYFYNSLLKSDTDANGIYTKYAELVNEIIDFLSKNVSEYFKIEEIYEIETPVYQHQA